MKILYLTPGCFDKGGISRYNRYQIAALREILGEENVRVLSLLGPDKNRFEDPIKVFWHGSKNFGKSKLFLLFQYVRLLLKFKPDLVWIGHVNFSGFAWLLAKLISARTILNVYGLEVWSGLSPDASWGLQHVTYVISDCHNTADYLEKNKIRIFGSTKVIWDCVDLNKFKPSPDKEEVIIEKYNLPSHKDYFIVLTLGRIAKEASHKGYERLLTVFSKVAKKHSMARLVFAGKGNMVDTLKQEVKNLELSDKVSFAGMIHDDDMAAIYSYADVFSLVSDVGKGRGEGIPLTPLEAMACGTPVIVGNQDGSREAIINDENGYCIDPNDLQFHAECILELIENRALLDRKTKAAFAVANEFFNYELFVEKHLDFLNGIE